MTQSERALAITQTDREAAARLYEWFPGLSSTPEAAAKTAQFVRDGGGDGWNSVQAFASHRWAVEQHSAGQRAMLEEMASRLNRVLATSGARGAYHALEYHDAVRDAEESLARFEKEAGDA